MGKMKLLMPCAGAIKDGKESKWRGVVREQAGTKRFKWMMIPLSTCKLLMFLDTVLYFFY